jgi:prophage antirepressor-like protein
MEVVRAFNANNLHTEIVIKGNHENPLFRASDVGLILGINNIRMTVSTLSENEKVIESMNTAGGQQHVTFLTENGLYKVLFRSRKPIAETFQNWVCQVIKEIRIRGSYTLRQEMEQVHQEQIKIEKALENQRILLSKFGSCGPCIYVIRVKSYENGGCVLKIGESRRGVEGRYTEHRKKYEEALLLECFPVLRSKDFESFLLHYEQIRPHRKTDLPGHEMEMELIELGNGLTYAMLMSIIQNNLDSFNHYGAKDVEALQRENELLKSIIQNSSAKGADCRQLMTEPEKFSAKGDSVHVTSHIESENPVYMIPTAASHTDDILRDILNTQKLILEKISNMEKQQSIPQQKTVTNFNLPLATLGPRLQQIDPDTMTLVKWYESMEDFLKQNGFNKFKRPSIAKAIENNTVYKGFRWSFVDRNQDPHILVNLMVTKQTKARNLGYVAKLDQSKSKILAVYLDRKVAAAAHGLCRSALEKPVKTGRIHNGHYYMMYENVDSVLRQEFESSIGNELLPFKTKGVEQYDADNNLVRTYSSRQECHESFNIGDRSLNHAIASGMPYNGYVYKLIDPKLFIECV